MSDPSSRRYAHSEGRTLICFDPKMRVVTCGDDCDVRIFEGDDSTEFSVTSDKLSAIACYHGNNGQDVVAVGMDDHSVQAFQLDGTAEGLLMRFTAPVTCLAVDSNHTLLAAGSSDFTIKIIEIADSAKASSINGHEAPILCVTFDPRGEYLASSSCDGTVKVWSLKTKDCVQTLSILHKSNDVSAAKSLATLAWKPCDGKMLAVPVGSEVKLYDRQSWKCMFSLSDEHHKEAVNVVGWSPCGGYVASGATDGTVCLWDLTSRKAYSRMRNENGIGVSALEWDPRGGKSQEGKQVLFGDMEGYVGLFENVYPSNKNIDGLTAGNDTLADDSLLMEGIPPDDIFDDFNDNDADIFDTHGDKHDHLDDENDSIVQSRKRRRLENNEATPTPSDFLDDGMSMQSRDISVDPELTNQIAPLPRKVMEFNEKLVQVTQSPIQSSSTPDHLQHRFMVYNLVGVVRCHTDNSSSMVEVDFHNTGTHHSFSLANFVGYSMAALSESVLVLASERAEDQPSQLQCTQFSSWDSNKEWTINLPTKESILSVTIGSNWIALVTNKLMLRLFTVGGVQREVISLPGTPVTVVGWGSRLAVIYQTGLGTSSVFSLTVWVLDVQRRRELHPPHSLPLSRNTTLEWIGFSEEGLLTSYDTKGIVRVLSNSYGRSSWLPVLDTNKQLGNKSDHYFIVGMTHNPTELRAILCKGMTYPAVHPKPVMSILQLKLPLCELNSEKTQLEDELIQLTMLLPPSSVAEGNTAQVQQLMKLFALACKSDREYRAYEIAAMLPDEHSMNLALTYASRTHHLKLARQISELIQQKSLEGFYSDEEDAGSDLIGQFDDGLERDEQDADHKYAIDRSEKLKQSSKAPQKIAAKGLRFGHKGLKGSKFSAPRNKDRKRSENNIEAENGVDETKELFSDEEGSVEGVESGVEGEGDSPTHSPPFVTSGSEQRHNPFKVATPISKKVQSDRRTGFLDNVVSEDQERKVKSAAKKGGKPKEKTVKPGKRNRSTNNSSEQTARSNPKSSFFKKQKQSPSTQDNTNSSNDAMEAAKEESMDVERQNNDCHNEQTESTKSSKEKLSEFSFKPST